MVAASAITLPPTSTTMPLPQICHAIIRNDAGILPAEMYELTPKRRAPGDLRPLVSPGIVDGKTLLTSTLEVMVGNVTATECTVNEGDVLGYISVLNSPAISTLNTDATSVVTLSSFISESESILPSVDTVTPGATSDLDYHPVIVIQPDFGGLVEGINSAVASDGKRMKVVLIIGYDETLLQANQPLAPDAVMLTVATDIDSQQLADSILSRIDQSVHALLPYCTAFIGQPTPAAEIGWSGRLLEHYSTSRSLALFSSTLKRINPRIAWTAFLHPSMKDFIPRHRYPFMTTLTYSDVAPVANGSMVFVVSTFAYPSFAKPTAAAAPKSMISSLRPRVAYKLSTNNGYDMPTDSPLCTIPPTPLTLSRIDNVGPSRALSTLEQGNIAGVPSSFKYPRSTLSTDQLFAGISSTAPSAFVRLLAQSVPIHTPADLSITNNHVVVASLELTAQIHAAATDRYAHHTKFLDRGYISRLAPPMDRSCGDSTRTSSFRQPWTRTGPDCKLASSKFYYDSDENLGSYERGRVHTTAIPQPPSPPGPRRPEGFANPCSNEAKPSKPSSGSASSKSRVNKSTVRLWSDFTEAEKAEWVRNNMTARKDWKVDLSDATPPSNEDIARCLAEAKVTADCLGHLGDKAESVHEFFKNDLFPNNYPLMDGVFREAGPEKMVILHTEIPYSKGFSNPHPDKLAAIKHIVDKMLQQKVIERAVNSPYSSPCFVVPKKHKPGETDPQKLWRLVQDYRKLNDVTVFDDYKPPPIESCLRALQRAKYFTFLDLTAGFWNMGMHEDSKLATTFQIPGLGSFIFNRCPMGLKNTPAHFQRHMDVMLDDYLWSIALAYIDDICIYSDTIEDHMTHLSLVFKRLKDHGHSIRLDKCSFFQVEADWLGYHVTSNGLQPQSRHVQGLENLAPPTNAKELKAVMGMFNYQRRFVRNFAALIHPLKEETKSATFKGCVGAALESFNAVKKAIVQFWKDSNTLYFPDPNLPLHIETDASKVAIAAYAYQIVDGVQRPIAYLSRSVKDAESRWYDIMETDQSGFETRHLETLAIIEAVEDLSYLIAGTKGTTVWTDHRNLEWLRQHKNPGRPMRWGIRLAQYDNLDIKYIPGEQNFAADAMSRLHKCSEVSINTLFAPENSPGCTTHSVVHFADITYSLAEVAESCIQPPFIYSSDQPTVRCAASFCTETGGPEMDPYQPLSTAVVSATDLSFTHRSQALQPPTRSEILVAQQQSDKLKNVVLFLNDQPCNLNLTPEQSSAMKLKYTVANDGLLMYLRDGCDATLVLPEGNEPVFRELRLRAMKYCHENLWTAHPGRDATLKLLRDRFHWQNMETETRSYVRTCETCAKAKATSTSRQGLMQSFAKQDVFDLLTLDIEDFKGAATRGEHGEVGILVMFCPFSHFLVATPIYNMTAEHLSELIFQHFVIPHGSFLRLTSDNQFVNNCMADLVRLLGAQHFPTTPYHSQGNPAERPIQSIKTMLKSFVNDFPKYDQRGANTYGHWPTYLPWLVAAYNARPLRGTGLSPYQIVTGRSYRWPSDISAFRDPMTAPIPISTTEYWKDKSASLKSVCKFLEEYHARQASANKTAYDAGQIDTQFPVGATVIMRVPSRVSSLALQYRGPYYVLGNVTPVTYHLRHCRTGAPVVAHVQRLRYYSSPTIAPMPPTMSVPPTPTQFHNLAPLQPYTMVALQSRTGLVYVAKVISVDEQTGHFMVHWYVSQKEDLHQHPPLAERSFKPQWSYANAQGILQYYRGERNSAIPHSQPVIVTLSRETWIILETGFQLTKCGKIPLDNQLAIANKQLSLPASV